MTGCGFVVARPFKRTEHSTSKGQSLSSEAKTTQRWVLGVPISVDVIVPWGLRHRLSEMAVHNAM